MNIENKLGEIIPLSVGIIVGLGILIYLVIHQRRKVIEWLKWATTEAEKQLGTKTGQLKLRTVFNWYCEKFPLLASVLPFGVFSAWVNVALETMKEWFDNNKYVKAYIEGDKVNSETEKVTEATTAEAPVEVAEQPKVKVRVKQENE